MERITHQDKLLAIIFRDGDWASGLNFFTPDDLFLQAGTWGYEQGTSLARHRHLVYERTARKTHELVYMRRGSMKVTLYDDAKRPIEERVLRQGDAAVMIDGGHGYEILEDGTQVLEVKNGPFVSVDLDKEKF